MIERKIKPFPVKLIIGFIFKDYKILKETEKILEKKFKEIDFESEIIPFNFTDYYEKEMGKDLKRKFISFKKLIMPQKIRKIKEYTIKIEKKFSFDKKRKINIDPGYLTDSQLVLSTTKPYFHRIYLGNCIWAEVTLFYQNKTFRYFDWTYPDYRTPAYIEIFNKIREIYLTQKRELLKKCKKT